MKKVFNQQFFLWAVGVMQPATVSEVHELQKSVLKPEDGAQISATDVLTVLKENVESERLLSFECNDLTFYSLTRKGNEYLASNVRKHRDKTRIFLLRGSRQNRTKKSEGKLSQGSAGVSPAMDTSTDIKGCAANKSWPPQTSAISYWPRLSWQLKQTGSRGFPSDNSTLPNFPSYFSFLTREQFAKALGRADGKSELDFHGLGLLVGLSPLLLAKMAFKPARYYRSFTIPKRGGGKRRIESPRIFLKIVQAVLLDFVFDRLVIHPAVHSFRSEKSPVTNALQHQKARYVGGVDIKDFFGSIATDQVTRMLIGSGFLRDEAEAISRLCTKDGYLPQGAPTSPALSNAFLYEFDAEISKYCEPYHLTYTRYADDITVSGNERADVIAAVDRIKKILLDRYGLALNEKKTRIASFNGQQRVTGIVVNHEASPPRIFMRRVRAVFHQVGKSPNKHTARFSELSGFIGYLQNFPKYSGAKILTDYRDILKRVHEANQQKAGASARTRTKKRSGLRRAT
jgi:retron-type reverse transcriptase